MESEIQPHNAQRNQQSRNARRRVAIAAVAVLVGADIFVRVGGMISTAQASQASRERGQVAAIAKELKRTDQHLVALEKYLKANRLKVQIVSFPGK